jgi:hypothetical protein
MRRIVLAAGFLFSTLFASQSMAQSLWTATSSSQQNQLSARGTAASWPANYKLMELNVPALQSIQAAAPFSDGESHVAGASFELPMPDGSIHNTSIVETSIWADPSIAQRIGVKTYTMIDPTSKRVEGNFTVANNKITGVMFSDQGMVYINPVTNGTPGTHMVHYLKDSESPNIQCLQTEMPSLATPVLAGRSMAGDCKTRPYRLAVAATGEYTAWAGGTVGQAQTYITITMNIVNAIYKRDVNVTFTLVDNSTIIFPNAATDPYDASLGSTALNQNQAAIDAALTSAGYDVGIVFSKGWSGGLAQLNAVCGGGKARGGVGYGSGTGANPVAGPQGQWFDGATAHELGHMFGATHTFSATNGSCGSNITLSTAWEPGSGSTLMAYAAAGCGAANSIQAYQDYYFHAGSIAQMQNYILSGATCVSGVTTANQAPTASAPGASFNIPANTPFMLKLTSTDANSGDALTYSWEQMDANFSSANAPISSNTSGPMFRSLPAATNPTRYFPALATLLSGSSGSTYEVLPSVARTMNFRGTVRDNSSLGSCTAEGNVVLNVHASSGFKVTQPGWGTNVWVQNGSNTATIMWDIASTNTAPVNAANVDILFSTDGGYTYPITLATNTPNDGQHDILIPSVNTNTGRVMVKGSNNVFFNISEEPVFVSHPMPVTFLGVTARKDGSSVVLDWSTATEFNSDKFIVQRSANGVEFSTEVGTVKAAGSSTTVKNYKLTDYAPMNGRNYYRIKEVDFDGKITYSNIVSVYFDKGSMISVFPNPVRHTTTVEISTGRAGKVNMEVYDNKGALVLKQSFNATAGTNQATIDLSRFSTGIYTLKCYDTEGSLGVIKLVKE